MRRRDLLRTGAGLAAAGTLSGCAGLSGLVETRPYGVPPVLEDRPDRVYYPTHAEGMAMAGTQRAGGYACALTFSYPHRFWLVTGTRTRRVDIASEDAIHLMVPVWHDDTDVVPPDVSLTARIERDGDLVAEIAPWPMLSQRMGYHFGDNVALEGAGTYDVAVELDVGGTPRTGELADAAESASFEFAFAYDPEERDSLPMEEFPDREGDPGALEPMEMVPLARVPDPEALPGRFVGRQTAGDVTFAVVAVTDAPRFDAAGETYLAVSAGTRYRGYPLALASLSATVERGGETAFDKPLTASLDPALGYHYGAAIDDLRGGDVVAVRIDAPPQAARHEGYETAFFGVPEVEFTA